MFLRRFWGRGHHASTLAAGAAVLFYCAGACAISEPNTEPIDSALSRSTASTTTETKPYQPNVHSTAGLTLLYNGSRGSKLEPCGCRSLNLGGIDREAGMVGAIRAASPACVLMDAGGFFREFTDENLRLQTYHLLEALNAEQIAAINIGYPDLRQGLGNLLKLHSQLHLPFISANIVNANTKVPIFDSHKLISAKRKDGREIRVAIVGVTAPNYGVGHPENESRASGLQLQPDTVAAAEPPTESLNAKWTISPTQVPQALDSEPGGAAESPKAGGSSPALEYAFTPTTATLSVAYEIMDEVQALTPLVARLRQQADIVVLASFTGWDRTKKIAEAVPGIDIAIAGEFLRLYEPERVGPGRTLLLGTDHDGKYLGQVDLELDAASKIVSASAELLPILQSIAPAAGFTKYVDAYKRESEALPIPEGQKIAEKLYAGAISCRTCHAMEFSQWKTHPHSHAMKTLVDKGMQYNVDCLRCHTVAYKQPGGFTDLRVTPGLSNVQCEVCHGPGQKHVEEQQKLAMAAGSAAHAALTSGTVHLKMQWDAKFCMQCHDPQNDPLFKFEEDIKRVSHRSPAAARIRPTTVSIEMGRPIP